MPILSKLTNILSRLLTKSLPKEYRVPDLWSRAPHLHIRDLNARPLKRRKKDPKVKGIRRRAR